MEISILKYNESMCSVWNDFLQKSENPAFFFHRDYINYHATKIVDHSLVFFSNSSQVIAVLPANQIGKKLHSHSGLSFGGLIYSSKYDTKYSLEIFSTLRKYLKSNQIENLIYKAAPFFHSTNQNHSDQFNLIKFGARLTKIDVSYCINLHGEFKPNRTKKRIIKKFKEVIKVSESVSLENFYELLSSQMKKRYDSEPVHSLPDLKYLLSNFPENIKIFGIMHNENLVAAILVFVFENVVKAQYITSNEKGFELEGISVLVAFLHSKYKNQYHYLDLGTSNESTMNINMTLAKFKESLGAIPKAIPTYELAI